MKHKKDNADELLDQLAAFGEARFGNAIKEYWFHADDLCPGCMKRKAGAVRYQGQNALSLNCYFYRQRGVLIGYLLCGTCARKALRASSTGSLHKTIERNLITAYYRDRPDPEGRAAPPS
ncbi:MAG: hypothetical protein ACE15E_20715 [Acidobacteriota bacterium]